jgi:hypothetical protein
MKVYKLKMVLSNSAKRARYQNTLIVQNQGGGSKKAGLPYQIGRTTWSNIHLGNSNRMVSFGIKKCCTVRDMTTLPFTGKVSQSRPIGRTNNLDYWHVPGTKG